MVTLSRKAMLGSAGASRSSLLKGLISAWKLDEESNGTATVARVDSHGDNDLSDASHMSESATGVNGNAAVTGMGKHLICPNNETLQTGDVDFTLAARVYLTSTPGDFAIVAKGQAGIGFEYALTTVNSGDRAALTIWGAGGAQQAIATDFGALALATWHDVIGWVNTATNTLNIEVDGVLTSVEKIRTPNVSAAPFCLGAFGDGTNAFPGRVDDVCLWKRTLSSAERAEWRNGTYPFDGSGHGIPTVDTVNVTLDGQAAQYLVPETPSGTLVIYHHGSSEDEGAWTDDALKAALRGALLAEGHILAASNAHGNNWGSAAALADYLALYTDAVTRYDVIKVVFLSQSMGGLSGLLCVADGTIPVAGWYGIYPVCSLADMWADGLGTYADAIKAAYGIAPDGSDYVAKTAGHDPLLLAGSLYDIPMRFTASPDDTVVDKTANSDAMSALVADYTPEETVVACTGNHGNPSHFQPDDVIAFIDRC